MICVEVLTWKFYKEVLNFEEESNAKFENIKILMDKSKVLKKVDDMSLFSFFDSKHALLVLSGNPNTL